MIHVPYNVKFNLLLLFCTEYVKMVTISSASVPIRLQNVMSSVDLSLSSLVLFQAVGVSLVISYLFWPSDAKHMHIISSFFTTSLRCPCATKTQVNGAYYEYRLTL